MEMQASGIEMRAEMLYEVRKVLETLVDRIPATKVTQKASTRPTLGAGRPRATYRVIRPLGNRVRLTEGQRAVYMWLTAHPDMPIKVIATGLKVTEGQVGAALKVLGEAKVVRSSQQRTLAAIAATSNGDGLVRAAVVRRAAKAVDDDILAVLKPEMFQGLTQAEAAKVLLAGVSRPVPTSILVTAFSLGGLTTHARHAVTNLHKTLRNHKEFRLVPGKGWELIKT